ncbi:MAG: type VI secretion system-associated protein TagF [Alphaproteobacteria bacterium]
MSDHALKLIDRPACGYFGKVPLTGDFIRHTLPEGFLRPWDLWLQTAIERSRTDLEEHWLKYYLTSPVWRFALSAGICGERPAVGVMMPSVDQVGRYFPLCLAAVLPHEVRPAIVAATEGEWFWKAECTVRASLEDGFELRVLDAAVRDIGLPAAGEGPIPPRPPQGRRPARPAEANVRYGWDSLRVDLGGDDLHLVYPDLLDRLLARSLDPYSLWWTLGSEDVDPVLIACRGLPPADQFAAFLDGAWERWGWGETSGRPSGAGFLVGVR